MPDFIEAVAKLATARFSSDWEAHAKEVFDVESQALPWGVVAAGRVQRRVNAQDPAANVPFAALIPKGQPDSRAYGGMSFVIFPSRTAIPLFGLVIGTQGLQPDETIIARPGHARYATALARWLNQKAGGVVAWAKRDPVRVDIDVPKKTVEDLASDDDLRSALARYGKHVYLLCQIPESSEPSLAHEAASAVLDLFFRERGDAPLSGRPQEQAGEDS